MKSFGNEVACDANLTIGYVNSDLVILKRLCSLWDEH